MRTNPKHPQKKKPQPPKKACVVGAGLVGSLWAIYLAKRGYQVDVFERRSDMRKAGAVGGRSINLALSDRGWKALEKTGIADKIKEVAIPMKGRMMHDVDGKLAYQPYGKEGQAIYSVSRGGLNLELVNIAESHESVKFHFEQPCVGIDMESAQPIFHNKETGKSEQLDYPLVFATDGAFSAVRSSLQRRPRFDYSQRYLEHGYKELTIPAAEDGTHQIEKNALHIWPRGHFMLIALPNLDGSFTCTLFLPFEGEQSFERLDTDENILAFFNEYFADTVPLMPTLLDDFKENPTSTLVTIHCHPWSYKEKVLMIGDASHAIVPFYGQGMNSGFEDCSLLDGFVEKYEEDWPRVLSAFDKSRKKDADAIAALALRNFIEMRDQVGDPKFLLRKKIAAWLHEQFPTDFVPMYSLVTFSHVPYSEALREANSQDELFAEILSEEGIEENWQTENVLEIVKKWMKAKE